ncbi:MAG: response regulator [Bacteroidetes bacterium]|nr:MAG: response regulator [Bacteroidota bacterium]
MEFEIEKKNLKILYVEDQEDVRLFLSKILKRHYPNIYLAENGKKGLEIYYKSKPDIIISDIKMPVMDGLSMAGRIKETDPNARIILTTAHSDMEYFIHSIDIGINHYILKPIEREKLFKAIDTCAGQILLEREIAKKNQDLIQTNNELRKREKELEKNLKQTLALKAVISKSEEKFRQLAENIQDAFWLSDSNKVLYVNEAFEAIFGISKEDLYNNPDAFFDVIHPQDKEEFIKVLRKNKYEKNRFFQYEFRILLPGEELKHVWYRNIFFHPNKSSDRRRVIAATDITWQKENEQLQRNLILAEKSAKLKRDFLTHVNHEMRTPLNGIMGMTDILLKTGLDENQQDYAETIRQSANNLMLIINDMLTINELDRRNIVLEKNILETEQLLGEIKNEFKDFAENKGLSFQIIKQERVPDTFVSDKNKIYQVLKNLLSNAIKFTHEGSVELICNSKKVNEEEVLLTFEVKDTGIGIKKENFENIFQSFSQAEQSDTRSFDGLGLGLTICNKTARLLKGNIKVESEPGKGSIFRFIIPVNTNLSNNAGSIKSINRQTPEINAHILYAEDKDVNRKIVSILLKNTGSKVDFANNGLEAIEKVKENKYDLILMDIRMPLMDGITATRELRKQFDELPPIIGVSANISTAEAKHYLEKGFDDYISKPLTADILYEKTMKWLNKRNNSNKMKKANNPEEEKGTGKEINDIPHLDEEILKELKDQTLNQEEILKDLYQTFLVEADSIMETIEEAVNKKDYKTLKEVSHALKGTSATVGAGRVSFYSSRMDQFYKQNQYNESLVLIEPLKKDYQTFKEIVLDMFRIQK